jgi:putative effector of murein hydrolase
VGWLLQLPQQVLLSLTTRAVTTPIAMSVSQGIGGIPELSAMFVILSGIFGAVIVKPLFNLLGLRDDMVLGTATGFLRTASARPGCFSCRKRRVPLLAWPWG